MEQYRINLTGRIDPKNMNTAELQSYIDKLKLDMKVRIMPDEGSQNELQTRLKQIRSEIDKFAKVDMFGDPSGKMQKAMITYKNTIGETVRETMQLVKVEETINGVKKDTLKWMNTSVKVTDDILQKERATNRELEKQNKLLEKSALEAEKFLSKTSNFKATGKVEEGRVAAQNLQKAVEEKDIENVKKYAKEMTVADAAIKQANYSKWSFSEQLNTAIQRTINYAASLGLVYGALRQIGEGIKFISDLNKQMVDIQIATGLSVNQTKSLAKEYNSLGYEIGATTLEVAKSAVTWLKQGKNVEESNELIRGSVMLAKLGLMETGEAANYLTSTLNGYKFEVGEVTGIIDRLISVDNAAKNLAEYVAIHI